MNLKKFLIILKIILLFILNIQEIYAYCESHKTDNFYLKSSGFVAKKINNNLIKVRMVQPNCNLEIKNLNSTPTKVYLRITNISPKRYKIRIKNAKILSQGNNFVYYSFIISKVTNIKTSPRLSNPNHFTFAIVGDRQKGRFIHNKILKKIEKTKAIFIISTGDIIEKGKPLEYRQYLKDISNLSVPCFITPGNHEVCQINGDINFKNYINPLNFNFNQGNYNFIIFNNARRTISKKKFNWLKKSLSKKKYNLIFMHIPAFSPWAIHKKNVLKRNISKIFMTLVKEFPVKLVCSGHIHGYNLTYVDGIKYIISGCAGALPYVVPWNGGYYHYILVRVNGNNISTKVYKLGYF